MSDSPIRLPNNWAPRPYQLAAWQYLEHGGKLAYLIWHRRAGKDDIALHRAAVAAHERVGNYWHMLPEATQARKAVWEAVNPHTGKRRIDEAFPQALRDTTRENEMLIRFKNGSTWQVVGSDNFDSLVGSPPIGIVFSEWALANPQSWAYLRPILAENGGWAAFITTPRGNNHAKRMYDALQSEPKAFVQKLTATDTGVFSQETLDAELRGYIAELGEYAGRAKFEQEYLCSFSAANVGAIFAKEVERAREQGRIKSVPYDPARLVHTGWDLGRGDPTAIWFWQVVGDEKRFIDYYESRGETIMHYLSILRGKGYQYDTLHLPHDAEHKHMETEKSVAQICRDNGFRVSVVPNLPLMEGINAARLLLMTCVFDAERCAPGLEGLIAYRWDENTRLGEFKATPVHDWASHPADGFRTAALAVKNEAPKMKPIRIDIRGIV